jgi:hypothetical protein
MIATKIPLGGDRQHKGVRTAHRFFCAGLRATVLGRLKKVGARHARLSLAFVR